MGKKILLVLGAFLALIILISFFLPSNVSVERSTKMKASPASVYAQISQLKNWEGWSPWKAKDPDMKIQYSDQVSGIGASYSWEGDPNKSGSGSLKIIDAKDNESLKTEIDFGDQGMAYGYWKLEEMEEETQVTWGFETDVSSPFVIGKFFGLMMDGLVGPDFEAGLASMKEIVESGPDYGIEILQEAFGPFHYIGIRKTATSDVLGQQMQETAMSLLGYMEKNNMSPVPPPVALYHTWGEEFEYTFGFKVSDEMQVEDDDIYYGVIEEGDYLKGVYFGAYESMEPAYMDMDSYMKDNNLSQAGPPFELYITDPMSEPDTSKWKTLIYFPIKANS